MRGVIRSNFRLGDDLLERSLGASARRVGNSSLRYHQELTRVPEKTLRGLPEQQDVQFTAQQHIAGARQQLTTFHKEEQEGL